MDVFVRRLNGEVIGVGKESSKAGPQLATSKKASQVVHVVGPKNTPRPKKPAEGDPKRGITK